MDGWPMDKYKDEERKRNRRGKKHEKVAREANVQEYAERYRELFPEDTDGHGNNTTQ